MVLNTVYVSESAEDARTLFPEEFSHRPTQEHAWGCSPQNCRAGRQLKAIRCPSLGKWKVRYGRYWQK